MEPAFAWVESHFDAVAAADLASLARVDQGNPANDDGIPHAPRFAWLDATPRERWIAAWETLWARFAEARSPERCELAERAVRWIVPRRRETRWPHVWLELVAWARAQGTAHLATLASAGAAWLREELSHPAWPLVWCEFQMHRETLPCADLEALRCLHARDTSRPLVAPRVELKRHEGPGVVALAALVGQAHDDFVKAWATQGHVRGAIVEACDGGFIVDVGVRIKLRTSYLWLKPGDEVTLRVLSYQGLKGFARVGELAPSLDRPDATVHVGAEEHATVVQAHPTGLAVSFRGFAGFIETSPLGARSPRDFHAGEVVRATVIAVKTRRALLTLAQ
jgi:hypothetical protein